MLSHSSSLGFARIPNDAALAVVRHGTHLLNTCLRFTDDPVIFAKFRRDRPTRVKIPTFLLILISVGLSAGAQIMLKAGLPAEVASFVGTNGTLSAVGRMLASPFVVAGLGAYGLGALVWLFVLARVDVSYAYPFLALGLVITVALSAILLGEHVGTLRIVGTCLIGIGIVCIANG